MTSLTTLYHHTPHTPSRLHIFSMILPNIERVDQSLHTPVSILLPLFALVFDSLSFEDRILRAEIGERLIGGWMVDCDVSSPYFSRCKITTVGDLSI
jgi:hypothetical protein